MLNSAPPSELAKFEVCLRMFDNPDNPLHSLVKGLSRGIAAQLDNHEGYDPNSLRQKTSDQFPGRNFGSYVGFMRFFFNPHAYPSKEPEVSKDAESDLYGLSRLIVSTVPNICENTFIGFNQFISELQLTYYGPDVSLKGLVHSADVPTVWYFHSHQSNTSFWSGDSAKGISSGGLIVPAHTDMGMDHFGRDITLLLRLQPVPKNVPSFWHLFD